jgi:hypothetical protein
VPGWCDPDRHLHGQRLARPRGVTPGRGMAGALPARAAWRVVGWVRFYCGRLRPRRQIPDPSCGPEPDPGPSRVRKATLKTLRGDTQP